MAMGAAAARAASEVQNYQGVHKQSAGFRLLASMGWQEGQGLGAKGQGITSHVKVSKKDDTTGIGSAEALRKARDWTAGMAVYDRVLASLKVVAPEQTGAGSSSNSDSDGEQVQPLWETKKNIKAEEKPKVAAEKKQKKRMAAAEKKQKKRLAAAEQETGAAKKPKLMAKEHTGHFQRLRRNKSVKGYSSTDLAAILGAGEAGGAAMAPPAAAMTPSSNKSSETWVESGEAPKEIQSQPQCSEWWHSIFRKAGSSGAGSLGAYAIKSKPDVRISGFSEDDQAGLWQILQDDQTRNRQGLGKGDVLNKVGGANWEGTKTVIESEDEEDTVAVQAAGKASSIPKRAKRDASTAAEVQPLGGSGQKRVKWKKLAAQALEAKQGGPMDLRKFRACVWKASGLVQGKIERMQEMALVLQSSKRFVITDNVISLRPR